MATAAANPPQCYRADKTVPTNPTKSCVFPCDGSRDPGCNENVPPFDRPMSSEVQVVDVPLRGSVNLSGPNECNAPNTRIRVNALGSDVQIITTGPVRVVGTSPMVAPDITLGGGEGFPIGCDGPNGLQPTQTAAFFTLPPGFTGTSLPVAYTCDCGP